MDKKYFKYDDDFSPLGEGITYIETLGGTDAIRQITVFKGEYHASNIGHPKYGINLADQSADYASIDKVKQISKQEFAEIWNAHLTQHRAEWEKAKTHNKVGKRIEGHIEIFYPQGVIVQLNSKFWGLANYDECLVSTTQDNMYTKHKITATVSGYDEENYWFVLKNPQVYSDQSHETRIKWD
mgnify:CR=1 FL=1